MYTSCFSRTLLVLWTFGVLGFVFFGSSFNLMGTLVFDNVVSPSSLYVKFQLVDYNIRVVKIPFLNFNVFRFLSVHFTLRREQANGFSCKFNLHLCETSLNAELIKLKLSAI